jgi:intergrase/recombinase
MTFKYDANNVRIEASWRGVPMDQLAEIGEKEEIEILNAGIEDAKYVDEHFEKFSREHEGKIIAVKNKRIIASADTIEELIEKVKAKKSDPRTVYVTSFPPKGLIFVL